jgi:ankyrin repeat protein
MCATMALAQSSSAASSQLLQAINRGEPQWRAWVDSRSRDAIGARDANGNTPLHLAALRENAEAVDALLKHGADANATNLAQATPLHYGIGSERIVRALLQHGAKPDVVSTAGMTPLLGAARHATSAVVIRHLVNAGADVNAIIPQLKMSVLAQAVFGGDHESIRFLLEKGANPNGGEGFRPLVVAAYTGDREIAELLLDRGADVNSANGFFGHALHATFFTGSDDVAALLIARGADVNLKSKWGHGTPPIVFAAYNEGGNPRIAELLVARGVDVNAPNDVGETAYSYALKRGSDTPLLRFLRESGATPPATVPRHKPVPHRALSESPKARTTMIRESAQRAVDALQRSSRAFLENGFVRQEKCVSCHQQSLPGVAFGLARERGLRVDEHELGRQLHAQMNLMWGPAAELARQLGEPFPAAPDDLGFGADALAALRYEPDDTTDGLVHYILRVQRPEGWWAAERRPPMQDGALSATAWAVRAIQLFPPAGEQPHVRDALHRARTWLAAQKPATHNERVFQLLGLAWSGAEASQLQPYARSLAATQRSDGGWAQLPALAPDAWATGSALVALHKAGIAPPEAVFQRGITHLLQTQFDDGSWWVRSRTWPFQPHFDGQFPHGKDQWISAGGTAWATIALLLTMEPHDNVTSRPGGHALLEKYSAAIAVSKFASNSPPSNTSVVAAPVRFDRDIKPLIERSCAGCHIGEKIRGGLNLATREGWLKGGNSGDPAIVPGRAVESQLLRYASDQIEDLEMPPLDRREKYPPLQVSEIELIRSWIEAGANWEQL